MSGEKKDLWGNPIRTDIWGREYTVDAWGNRREQDSWGNRVETDIWGNRHTVDSWGNRRKEDHRSGGGGCYIATATLRGGGSEMQLNLLRSWRDEVLTSTEIGRLLETFYDRTGPSVAQQVARNSLLAHSFLIPFVRPSVWLAQQREKYPQWSYFFDSLLYLVFILGLGYGSIVYFLHSYQHTDTGKEESHAEQ